MSTEKVDIIFYKKFITLVLPIAFQYLMSAAVSASDALMLGFLDQDSLSAVSLAGQVQFVYSLFLSAFMVGTTTLSAQYWGKQDFKAIEKIFGIVLCVSMGTSIVFFLGTSLIPHQIMQIFTNDSVLIQKGAGYLRVVSGSYLLSGISQIYLCIMKNTGRTLKSTIYASVSMLSNIVLNAFLIFGLFFIPSMGITGAAVATVFSKVLECVLTMSEQFRSNPVKLRWRHMIHPDALLWKDFKHYTSMITLNEIIWGLGFTMYSVIMGHMGNDAVAANSIANIVKNLITCVSFGIASGAGIIIGNTLGEKRFQLARLYGDALCKMTIICGAVSGLILFALRPVILAHTNLTPTAMGYLSTMLLMCTYYLIGKSINCTTNTGIFAAGGDIKFGLVCDTITMWVYGVPLGLIAAFVLHLPVEVVYFIINLDELVKLPAVYIHYKKYKWINNITREK